MNPILYWILLVLAVIGWCALWFCVASAAEQAGHIARETLFTVGDEHE